MANNSGRKRNITPQIAKEILKKNGVEVSEDEAEKILELMYFFAKLVVNQNVKI
jgi:hypothetical protein